jgi:hypothetical protein
LVLTSRELAQGQPQPPNAGDDQIELLYFSVSNEIGQLYWKGSQPPYRVQALTESSEWVDISAYLNVGAYTVDCNAEFTLFRVRSAIDNAPPTSPSGLKLAARRCEVLALVWDRAEDDLEGSGIGSYRIYRDGVAIGDVPSPGRFFLDKDASTDTNYVYTLTSLDRVGNESAPSAALLVDPTTCVEENSGLGGLTLTWDPAQATGVSGYLVYWGEDPEDYRWVLDAMDYNAVRMPDLKPGRAYFFAVTAYDSAGVQSPFSTEAVVITPETQILPP